MFFSFGRSAPQAQRQVLLLDIENASVGGALVELRPGHRPKILAEKRIALPIFQIVESARLAREVERAVAEVLVYMRKQGKRISHTAVFLGVPWASPVWQGAQLRWEFEPHLQRMLVRFLEDSPASFHAFSDAATHAIDAAFEHDDAFLLCVVTGEVAEILSIQNNLVVGRATVPFGAHTALRTLASHSGTPLAAAHSALKLIAPTQGSNTTLAAPSWMHEPLSAVEAHFTRHFTDVAGSLRPMDQTAGEPRSVLVIAPEPFGELFAGMLGASTSVAELFPQGGVVRALRRHHLLPHLSLHAGAPDEHLLAEALFAQRHFLGGN